MYPLSCVIEKCHSKNKSHYFGITPNHVVMVETNESLKPSFLCSFVSPPGCQMCELGHSKFDRAWIQKHVVLSEMKMPSALRGSVPMIADRQRRAWNKFKTEYNNGVFKMGHLQCHLNVLQKGVVVLTGYLLCICLSACLSIWACTILNKWVIKWVCEWSQNVRHRTIQIWRQIKSALRSSQESH